MNIDRLMFVFAGGMILLSLVLTRYVHEYFIWFTAFVGFNMIQAAFTGFCPAAKIFSKLGIKTGCAFR